MLNNFQKHKIALWLLYILIFFAIALAVFFYWKTAQPVSISGLKSPNLPFSAIIQGNSLLPISPIEYPDVYVLASKIKECESGSNPDVCNKDFGCKAGMGLFQLIPSTIKYCEEKLGREIDPFNAQDNTDCAIWLLKNEGSFHWGCEDCDWGSYKCWKDFE